MSNQEGPEAPAQPPMGDIDKNKTVVDRYWLAFGCLWTILIFVLLALAFYGPENSCDRWTLLRYVLPIFCGMAAGSFGGAISARTSINQLAVVAGGGFAVWLISLLVIGEPGRCQYVRITNFQLFDNSKTIGAPGNKLPIDLKPMTYTYDVSDPRRFVFFFGAVISNIYWDQTLRD